jgi:F-box protein 9
MADEPEELVRFREAWKAEVQLKKAAQDSPQAPTSESASQIHSPPDGRHRSNSQPTDSDSASVKLASATGTLLASAVEIYSRAVQHEQRSELDDALRLYRQAFRMDANVDKAHHRQEKLAARVSAAADTAPARVHAPARAPSAKLTSGASVAAEGTLASLLAAFPKELKFGPEDERASIPINSLPDELLVLVLRKLGPMSVERFASVGRKARVVSLDPEIWRCAQVRVVSDCCDLVC